MVNDLSLLSDPTIKPKYSSLGTITGCVPDSSVEIEGYGYIQELGEVLYGSELTVNTISLSQLDKAGFCINI